MKIKVPSSKSLSNRALILAALTKGRTVLRGGSFEAEDIQIMVKALKKLGVEIKAEREKIAIRNDFSWRKGKRRLTLSLGNSGTSMRFLTTLACLRSGTTILTGIPRMKERPIGDLVNALRSMGAEIRYVEREGFPPIEVVGHGSLSGGKVLMKGDLSSQFITSLLLCERAFDKPLRLEIQGKVISRPYLGMTHQVINQWNFVFPFRLRPKAEWRNPLDLYCRKGFLDFAHLQSQLCFARNGKKSKRITFVIEGDASAAVYWWAYSALHGKKIEIKNLPRNSKQGDIKFQKVLKEWEKRRKNNSIFCSMLQHGASLHMKRWTIDMNAMPDASLMLMAMAMLIPGETKISNIGSLRVKETDRIEAMATELRKLGARVETGEDWIKIAGSTHKAGSMLKHGANTVFSKPVAIDTYNDHRIAMAFAILSTVIPGLHIKNPGCVRKSYPGFWEELKNHRVR